MNNGARSAQLKEGFDNNFRDRLCGKLLLIFSSAVCATFSTTALANVVGTDTQNFNPTSSGLDFVTVQSSETLEPGIVNLGLFFNFAVNSLPYFDNSPQGRLNFNDSLLGMDLNAGLGLTQNWDIGLSIPQVLMQSVEDQTGARGEFAQTGATEVRLNTKYRLLGDATGGVALVGSVSLNRIEDNPWVGRNAGPTFTAEVAADTTYGDVAYGVNLGYRARNPGERIITSRVEPLGNQLIASAAASYHMSELNTKVIGEIFGSLPAEGSTSYGERSLTSLELLLGAKHDWSTNLALHAGAGAGLIQGVASPDWRVYTGVNYTFGPLWAVNESSESGYRHLTQILPQDPEPAAPVERFRTRNILFEFDSDRMLGEFAAALEELATHLRSGFRELVIEGHTDSIGAAGYNQRLSQKRAIAIKRHLSTKLNIDASKIVTIGFGETRPIADNGNYQGRQENRRVEFEIKR